jgi:F-type H+-transporting ATPase subunit b
VLSLVHAPSARTACETCRKHVLIVTLLGALVLAVPVLAPAQEAHPAARASGPAAAAPDGDHATAPTPAAHGEAAETTAHQATEGHEGGGEEHGSSPWGLVGKIVNFAVLVGTVAYFARRPFAQYLADRGAQIRTDLVRARETRDEAGRQIAEIESKMQALPAEIDVLRSRGREEVAAEAARIDEAAAQERDRLLEATRREIELQLRIARRDLVTHAADLAVQVARERIRERITGEDQARLVDQYLARMKKDV